ncbi:galactose oxidase early set domain-containing protein [Kitasatospora cinereorecta]|uniref:Galactose oxidase early set domain-containing protein n=1 Tax=Kitasatospora cinereorecta TaxID=285560 RepID=A0ABW0VGU7_9ACTN
MSRTAPPSRARLAAAAAACVLASSLTASLLCAAPASAAGPDAGAAFTAEQVDAAIDPAELAALGHDEAAQRAWIRLESRAAQGSRRAEGGPDNGYPNPMRINRLKALTDSQKATNGAFDPAVFGKFTDYFPSPDYGDHIALLPTGKVLVFSFEAVETDPTKEPAPTNVIGLANAGRAYLWDPAKGTGADAFKAVPPPNVVLDDGTGANRPAPFFCAGHSYLPNGMVGVFGGNLGGNGGAGAKLSLIFDPWKEQWTQNPDMQVGRWYPSVVTGADGRQLIMSGQSELGWGTPTPIVERFPAKSVAPEKDPGKVPNAPVDRFGADAPFTQDYPQLFSLNDGKVYGLGRVPGEQWVFDPKAETRADLPARPDLDKLPADAPWRNYGSAVALPGGVNGPDSVLVLGGNRKDPNTYQLAGGQWSMLKPRAFGRTQDDTLIFPDGKLFTVNGAFDIRDYGNGPYNPNADLKYRQTEFRDDQGNWKLGPVQRLPRGYHSNAVILPDGRVMITGDELQQIANNPDIKSGMNGTIEIYEPPYLQTGNRPALDSAPTTPVRFNTEFQVSTSTPSKVSRAVLLAPITSTHSVNTSQRHLELRINNRNGGQLTLQAPPLAAAAPPGYYMLFLLDSAGVPSAAKWIKLEAKPSGGQIP